MVAGYPQSIGNWIAGAEQAAADGATFDKLAPHDSRRLAAVARSRPADVDAAVKAARTAFPAWADTPPVQRGAILHRICNALEARGNDMAAVVGVETGKSSKGRQGHLPAKFAVGDRPYAGI